MPRVKLVFKNKKWLVIHAICLASLILACETFSMLFIIFTLPSLSTFVGEACGLAMGLVMLGSKSATAIEEMVGVSLVTFSPH